MTKLVSLTTSYLRIYEDDPNHVNVPNVKEPTTKVLHEIRFECFGCDHNPCGYGFQVQMERRQKIRALNCAAFDETGGSGFDLLFDSSGDEKEYLRWNGAIQKAEELNAMEKTLLDLLKQEIENAKLSHLGDLKIKNLLRRDYI